MSKMAAVAVKGIDGLELLQLLQISKADIVWLKKYHVEVSVLPTEIKIWSPVHGIQVSVPVKLTHLTQLKHGQLGALAKQSLRLMVQAQIKQVKVSFSELQAAAETTVKSKLEEELVTLGFPPNPVQPEPEAGLHGFGGTPTAETPHEGGLLTTSFAPPSVGAMALLKKSIQAKSAHPEEQAPIPDEVLAEAGLLVTGTITDVATPSPAMPATPVVAHLFPKFPVAQMKTAEPVKLRDATMLYQPVRGSNATSRYFVVGANADLRIAARWKGNNLSVRIEGPGFEQHVDKINGCGFTNCDKAKGYASMHLETSTPVLTSKTLGAVLMGLGVPLDTPVPDLLLLKDKGS
jgi:hypothetical protein